MIVGLTLFALGLVAVIVPVRLARGAALGAAVLLPVVAAVDAGRERLVVPTAAGTPEPRRDAFLDYVLVGSLASWAQAVVLGLLVAG